MDRLLPVAPGSLSRGIAFVPAVALGLLSFALETGISSAEAETFKTTAPDGSFTVLFPNKPHGPQSIPHVRMSFGQGTLVFYASQRQARETMFLAGFMNYPDRDLARMGHNRALAEVREAIRQTHAGRVLHEVDSTDQGHPTKDFLVVARFNNDPMFLRVRLVLAGNRIYRLIVNQLDREPSDEVFTSFFESFQLAGGGE